MTDMEELEMKYAAFERLMDEGEVFMDPSVTFEGICSTIGVDPTSLEKLLIDELGFTGAELLEKYRENANQSF